MSNITHLDDHRPPAAPVGLPQPLPANIEAEQMVLGALLCRNDLLPSVCDTLQAEHFSEEIHQRVFAVVTSLTRDGRPATPVTLKSYFSPEEFEPGMTMQRYLAHLAAAAMPDSHLPGFVRELEALAGRRRLIALADEARALAFDPPPASSVDSLIDAAESGLATLRASAPAQVVTSGTAGEMSARLIGKLKRIQAGEEKPSGVSTGIPSLDQDTGGLAPGQLWIIAGRPSMGKTIFATRLVRSASRAGVGALLFSLEVNEEQINARLLADMAYSAHHPLTFGAIMKGRDLDEADVQRLEIAQKRLNSLPIVIDCPSGVTVSQLASKVRAQRLHFEKRGTKLGVVVIDYLDFIAASDRYKGNRVYEVAEISRSLKQLAKDQGLCVVLLAQINRQVEQRPDKRPMMSDLRDSGNLEQDADVVAMIYREAYYLQRSAEASRGDADALVRLHEARNRLELIIGKNRAGPTHKLDLWCDVACSAVSEKARGGKV